MSNESKTIVATADVNTAADLVNFLVGLPDDKIELGTVDIYSRDCGNMGELFGATCYEITLTDGSKVYDVVLSFA
jgi:hypothetical protein